MSEFQSTDSSFNKISKCTRKANTSSSLLFLLVDYEYLISESSKNSFFLFIREFALQLFLHKFQELFHNIFRKFYNDFLQKFLQDFHRKFIYFRLGIPPGSKSSFENFFYFIIRVYKFMFSLPLVSPMYREPKCIRNVRVELVVAANKLLGKE